MEAKHVPKAMFRALRGAKASSEESRPNKSPNEATGMRKMFGRLSAPSCGPSSDDGRPDSPASPAAQGEIVTIFDWDDTLCPTWWITRVLSCGLNHVELERVPNDAKLATVQKTKKELAMPTSQFRAPLEAHARAVEALLRAARSVSQVSVVTLGSQLWFENCSVFFPGLDVPALFRELGIQVYFAEIPAEVPAGTDCKVAAKRISMAECLIKHYGIACTRWNVLSVGDQPEECEALKLCCRECPHRRRSCPVCKTLTVEAQPMLQEMTDSLERLIPVFPRLVLHDRDADWTLSTAMSFVGDG